MPLLRHISLVISCAYLCARTSRGPPRLLASYFSLPFFPHRQFIIYIFPPSALHAFIYSFLCCLWKIYACPCLFMISVAVLCHVISALGRSFIARLGSRIVPLLYQLNQLSQLLRLQHGLTQLLLLLLLLLLILMLFPKGCSNQRRWMNPLWAAQIKRVYNNFHQKGGRWVGGRKLMAFGPGAIGALPGWEVAM